MPEVPELNPREREILHAVVRNYITTAEPVGSRTVVKRYDMGLSAATVRNVMADLEELGYLKQLHTSSGRVPTDMGYRYYVSYLMRVRDLTEEERARINREFEENLSDVDEVLRQTSHLLALISHQAGVAELPRAAEAVVKQVELMAIGPGRLAVLLVDNFGRVRTTTVEIEHAPALEALPKLSAFLTEQLDGVPVEEMAPAIQRRLRQYLDEQRLLAEQALSVLNMLPPQRSATLFLDGAEQLFEQPEFQDVERARKVFGFLGEEEKVVGLLRAMALEKESRHGAVFIGIEDIDGSVEGISVVASPYQIGGKQVGMVGILGPRRMPYSRLSSLVSYTAGMVGRALTKLSR